MYIMPDKLHEALKEFAEGLLYIQDGTGYGEISLNVKIHDREIKDVNIPGRYRKHYK